MFFLLDSILPLQDFPKNESTTFFRVTGAYVHFRCKLFRQERHVQVRAVPGCVNDTTLTSSAIDVEDIVPASSIISFMFTRIMESLYMVWAEP